MSPRRSVIETRATRARILDSAADIASAEGLEGLSIGRLADALSMSKSGVHGHFGSKEALQVATLEQAFGAFWRLVVEPTDDEEPGLARLQALCDASVGYLADPPLRGGCLMTASLSEFDGRPGPVRDEVAGLWSRWSSELDGELRTAVTSGELAPDTDVEQVLFEILAAGLALNAAVQLRHDPHARARARRAIDRALGLV